MKNHCLPFEVGQEAESKSFESGFRGAWFRCKIKGIRKIKGNFNYALEYFDFPDEKIQWTKLYQKPSTKGIGQMKKMHLMVRPRFPPVFRESEVPNICAISEVVAIVDDVWEVGDLVDWMADGCYWSGTITHLLGEDKVKIKLSEPPVGEGMSYEASFKDLRPSLDWSPEFGWTVPISMESETTKCCVHLIQPNKQDEGEDKNEHCDKEEKPCDTDTVSLQSDGSYKILLSSWKPTEAEHSDAEPNKGVADLSEDSAAVTLTAPVYSHVSSEKSPSSSQRTEKDLSDTEPNMEVADLCATAVSSRGSSGPLPSSREVILRESSDDGSKEGLVLNSDDININGIPTLDSEQPNSGEDSLVERVQKTMRGDSYDRSFSKKDRNSSSGGVGFTNSALSDTLEAAVLDLEELANRIKWLRRVHQFGLDSANASVPSWKYLEERVSSEHNR